MNWFIYMVKIWMVMVEKMMIWGTILFIGHSIHSIYGYKVAGIVQKDDTEYIQANGATPGNPKYVDVDGNGTIGVEDRTILGTSDPRFKMSLSNTLHGRILNYILCLLARLEEMDIM